MSEMVWHTCGYEPCKERFYADQRFKFCSTVCRLKNEVELRKLYKVNRMERKPTIPHTCGTCKHGAPCSQSDTGFQCTMGLALICKPWLFAHRWEAK